MYHQSVIIANFQLDEQLFFFYYINNYIKVLEKIFDITQKVCTVHTKIQSDPIQA